MICSACNSEVILKFRRMSNRPGEILYNCPNCNAPYQAREHDGIVGPAYQVARKGATGHGRKQLAVTATREQREKLAALGIKPQAVFNAGLDVILSPTGYARISQEEAESYIRAASLELGA